MREKIGLAVLGGDERQIAMAAKLCEYGHRVFVWGLGRCAERIGSAALLSNWQDAVAQADAVILPLPASADGVRVHCPLQEGDILLRIPSLLDEMQGKLLLGGRLSESILGIAEQKQIDAIDYFDSEILQLKNAVPTAEGAIAIAMRELPVTLDGTKAAVIGYGRIGALLADKLRALGAQVTVYARRSEALTLAEMHHHAIGRLISRDGHSAPETIDEGCRVIFNTVPQWILTREVLNSVPKKCVLIDLASAPGGIDRMAAEELGLRCIWGTSLPGKCAPESAGRILAETLSQILENYSFS